MEPAAPVLIVGSDPELGSALSDLLAGASIGATLVGTGAEALRALDGRPFNVLITAFELPDMPGSGLLRAVADRWPGMPVVFAGNATAAQAVEALRAGATDVLLPPFVSDEVGFVVQKSLTVVARRADASAAPGPIGTGSMLGDSPAMREVYSVLKRAAPLDATVLVRGESGTGKELVARAIHQMSPRSAAPLVKIDCASLPENLLESELFGYEKGAFTGAVGRKPGRVELAEGGTLFLDEIGEVPVSLQAKLLRVLQDREFERLGGTKTLKANVRIVAATHRDLETMITHREFRQDLFYRLHVVPIWLTPLRTRREDIDVLATHFCTSFAAAHGKPGLTLAPDALRALRTQRWPGNVRQLQNFIERLVVLSDAPTLGDAEVRGELGRAVRLSTQPASSGAGTAVGRATGTSTIGPLDVKVREVERRALVRALDRSAGNRALAARLLDVSRSTLYAKLEEYGLL